jgi:hypothetical protein
LRELNRTGWLDVVRVTTRGEPGVYEGREKHPIAQHAIPQLCAIIDAYSENVGQVRTLVERQADQEEWLRERADASRKKSKKSGDPKFARSLDKLAKKMGEVRRGTMLRVQVKLNEDRVWVPLRAYGRIHQSRQLESWLILHLCVRIQVLHAEAGHSS